MAAICTVAWCEEPAGHLGLHRVRLGEVLPDTPQMVVAVAVTVEGQSHADRWPVLSIGSNREHTVWARLTFDQADTIAGWLTSARRRFA
jgi:hypothetical protein